MPYNHESHPVMFRSRPFAFLGALLLIPAFGLGLIILGIWRWKTKTTTLAVNDKGVIFSYGILNKEVVDLPISRINTIRVYKPFVERMMGTGSIDIFSAGDRAEISIVGLLDPTSIRKGINELKEIESSKARNSNPRVSDEG